MLAWGFEPGRLEILQRKAIRAVTRSRRFAHTEPLFRGLKVLTVNDILLVRGLKFYYSLKNYDVPSYFLNMFHTVGERHGHNTRGASNLDEPNTRTIGATKCLRSFIPRDIETFDKSIIDMVHTHSFSSFSIHAKRFIISRYSSEICTRADCHCRRRRRDC